MTEKLDLSMWFLCVVLSLCMGMFWGALLYWLWPTASLIVGTLLGALTFWLLVWAIHLPDPLDDDWNLHD